MSRQEERDALGKLADMYRQWNETYRQTGRSPISVKTNERQGLLPGLPTGVLRPSEEPPFAVEISPEARQILKRTASVDSPAKEIEYLPVTEIHSEHFRWTEAGGIEETVSEAEELAARKEGFRQEFTNTISRAIGEILKPRATYEEAFDALYARESVAWQASFDDSRYGFSQILTPVNGAFGVLGAHLNDYLKNFGAEDGYFDTLLNALDELGSGDDNAILRQMRSMVQTVRDGKNIDVESDAFKEDVRDAVAEVYGGKAKKVLRQKDGKEENEGEPALTGFSYLDMERHKAKEEKRLLDKLTGKETDEKAAPVGDVLAWYRRNEKGEDFQQQFRGLDEPNENEPERKIASQKAKSTGTPIDKEETELLQANYDAWSSISERYGWGTMEA